MRLTCGIRASGGALPRFAPATRHLEHGSATTLKPGRPSRRRLNHEAAIKPRRFTQECPMIKVFGYLKRKPGLPPQEFADYHEHNHVPLVLSKAFMPMVYKRNYIQRGDAFNIEGNEIGFDCMTELIFADREDLSAWMA